MVGLYAIIGMDEVRVMHHVLHDKSRILPDLFVNGQKIRKLYHTQMKGEFMKYLPFVILLVGIIITAGCIGSTQNNVVTPTPQIVSVTVTVTPTLSPTPSPGTEITNGPVQR